MDTLKFRAVFLIVSVVAIVLTIMLSNAGAQNAYGAGKIVRANGQTEQITAVVKTRAECPTQVRG